MKFLMCRTRIGLLALAALLLPAAGCVSAPVLGKPSVIDSPGYLSAGMPEKTTASDVAGGEAQAFLSGSDIPGMWWELFRSENLDVVIRMALAHSPTLEAARAKLREARENFNARAGTEHYPSVNAQAGVSRQKTSPAAAGISDGKGSIFNLHNASVGVSYVLDVFGSGRRELEALRAQVDYQQYQLQGARLALTANIVTLAVKEASLREQLEATHEIVLTQQQQLELLQKQLALGGIARAEVLAQRTQLEQMRATLPSLEKALALTRHQLVLLTGEIPSQESDVPSFKLDELHLPQELPLTLPSQLARQRPDVLAAEALLGAASAGVGVAHANLYPQFTLSASYGGMSATAAGLGDADRAVWDIGAGLVQPLFNGGSLRARERAAVAAYEAVLAQYKQVLLTAFGDVADALRALGADAAALKAQVDVEIAAGESLALARRQFEAGAVDYSLLLNAQQQYQQARLGLIQAQAARLSDTAALFQALGGIWTEN